MEVNPVEEPDTPQPEPPQPVTPQIVSEAEDESEEPMVTEPSKLIRIASMTRAMLEEVRQAPLDEAGRHRLLAIYRNSINEMRDVVSEELREELDATFVPFASESASEAELRVAQAQLVGWLEGLFSGIQASLWSQQMQAAAQLEQMRRRQALEAGRSGTGQYL